MEKIFVPSKSGISEFLGKAFNRSQPFIRKSLRGQTNHPDAEKVRALALIKIEEYKKSL